MRPPHFQPILAREFEQLERPGNSGPSYLASSLSLVSPPGALCDQRPLNILQLLRRLGVPSILRSHHQSLQPQRRSFYVSSSTQTPSEMAGHWRGTGGLPGSCPALGPTCLHLLPGGPCTWVRERLGSGSRTGHGQITPGLRSPSSLRAAELDLTSNCPYWPLGSACFRGGEASRGTPPRPHKTGSPSVTRTPRAPPASGQDAFTSGGWAVPAPPTSLRTSGAQGGLGAGPGWPRELRTRRRNLDHMVGCCPLFTL